MPKSPRTTSLAEKISGRNLTDASFSRKLEAQIAAKADDFANKLFGMSLQSKGRVILLLSAFAFGIQSASAISWFFPVSKFFLRRLTGSNTTGVALTFDDGPDIAFTPKILEILDNAGINATFFMLGEMVERNPELAREVADRGHQIGIHGYEHRNHIFRSPRTVAYDFAKAKDIIEKTTGTTVTLARPPYGVISIGTIFAARKLGLSLRLWTSWGRDWRKRANPQSVLSDLVRHGVDKGCILLHDSDCTSSPGSTWSTIGALSSLIEYLAQNDIKVVKL